MKENYKLNKYNSGNKKTETYMDGVIAVTKHYYDAKDAYTKEIIHFKDEVSEIRHFTANGVLSKLEHFVDGRREGQEIKYMIAKANNSIKSSKNYADGKLHGECITYNQRDEIIKHEVFAIGKLVLKYLREDESSDKITAFKIIDEDNLMNIPEVEREKLESFRYLA